MSFNDQLRSLLVAAALVLGLAFSDPANAQSARHDYQTMEISPSLYSFGAGLAFNAFMVTDDGVIVMDSFDKDFAEASLAAIRKVTNKPIRYLIYSHNHYDH